MTEKNKDIVYGDVELTEEERQAKQGKIRVSTMVDEDVVHKYRELEQENQRLRAECEEMREALKVYADSSKWGEFISNGNIFDEQDGDHMIAFDSEDETPWLIAKQALKSKGSKVSMLVEALNYTTKRIDSYFAGQKMTTIDLHMIMETACEALKEWEK